jgi:hypothetical protein
MKIFLICIPIIAILLAFLAPKWGFHYGKELRISEIISLITTLTIPLLIAYYNDKSGTKLHKEFIRENFASFFDRCESVLNILRSIKDSEPPEDLKTRIRIDIKHASSDLFCSRELMRKLSDESMSQKIDELIKRWDSKFDEEINEKLVSDSKVITNDFIKMVNNDYIGIKNDVIKFIGDVFFA